MPKINLKTQAYNTIRQKIVTCEYAPGTFLNEELLTSELGLSRTPIRDALSRLEQEGLIEIKPKKGILVMPLSINTISMIFEVRQLYEPYILLNYGTSLSIQQLKKFYSILVPVKQIPVVLKIIIIFMNWIQNFTILLSAPVLIPISGKTII